MADSTIRGLVAPSVLTADHQFAAQKTSTATATEAPTFALMGGLEILIGTDADTTMVVGSLYKVDMSAWATAVRTYRLPSTAKVGERIGIYVTAGNATHEIAIRTVAASNDTINGVDYDTADWSKLFITGEIVIFECVTADTDWIVLHDGRIPCIGQMQDRSGSTLDTTLRVPNFDTTLKDRGGIVDLTNDVFVARRVADTWHLIAAEVLLVDGAELAIRRDVGGSPASIARSQCENPTSLGNVGFVAVADAEDVTDGEQFDMRHRTDSVSGTAFTSRPLAPTLMATEQLKT